MWVSHGWVLSWRPGPRKNLDHRDQSGGDELGSSCTFKNTQQGKKRAMPVLARVFFIGSGDPHQTPAPYGSHESLWGCNAGPATSTQIQVPLSRIVATGEDR